MDCRFFSFGAVSKDGPSKEMAEGTNFEMTLLGKGWKQEGKPEGKPDRKVNVVVFLVAALLKGGHIGRAGWHASGQGGRERGVP